MALLSWFVLKHAISCTLKTIQRASKSKIFFSRHQPWWFLFIPVDRIFQNFTILGLRIRFPVILYHELELDNFFHLFYESCCFRLSYTSNFQRQKRPFLAKREEEEFFPFAQTMVAPPPQL